MKTNDGRTTMRLDPPKGMGPLDKTGRPWDRLRRPYVPVMSYGYRRVLVPYTTEELRNSKDGRKAHIQIMKERK